MIGKNLVGYLSFLLWWTVLPMNTVPTTKNLAYDDHYEAMRTLIMQQQANHDQLKQIKQSLVRQLQQLKKNRDSMLRKHYSISGLSMPFSLMGTLWAAKQPRENDDSYLRISWLYYSCETPLSAAKKFLGMTLFSTLFFVLGATYLFGYDADEKYVDLQGDKQIERIEELLVLLDQQQLI